MEEKGLAKYKKEIVLILFALFAFDVYLWGQISFAYHKPLSIYFLDVGQGDSEVVVLPSGVKILIDGGQPNGKLVRNLEKILKEDHYLDLVMMTHPQLDHFGGFIEMLDKYKVGAFLWSGRGAELAAYQELEKELNNRNIPKIILSKGDKIKNEEDVLKILSPTQDLLRSKELNDTTIVAELFSSGAKVLFTGDIGFQDMNVEGRVLKTLESPIDVLKVPHHGSKYSSGANFLGVLKPKLAVIEVGKNNYGHPTMATLNRLEDAGTKIYRTDINGTIKVIVDGGGMRIGVDKQ